MQPGEPADGAGGGKVVLAVEVAWDIEEVGYDCASCPDEERVQRFCTKPLRDPEEWAEERAEMPPGRPCEYEGGEWEDLCAVLRVPWWARELIDDIEHYRNLGGEFLEMPSKWHQLVAHASRLSRQAEAKWMEKQKPPPK